MLLFIFTLVLAFTSHAAFDLKIEGKSLSATELNASLDTLPAFKKGSLPSVSIFNLKDYDNVYVALFSEQKTMNLSLDRATRAIYFEKKTVLSDKDFLRALNKNGAWGTLGHDHYGHHLKKYLQIWKQTPNEELTPETKDLEIENAFWNNFIKEKMQQSSSDNLPHNGGLVLLAAPGGSSKVALRKMKITVSHELLHAQFAKDLKVQKIVSDVWLNDVTEADRSAIVKELKRAGYSVALKPKESDANFLLRNEFYAYLLQQNAEHDSLKEQVQKYQKILLKALAQENLKPLSLN